MTKLQIVLYEKIKQKFDDSQRELKLSSIRSLYAFMKRKRDNVTYSKEKTMTNLSSY